jgi:hypothetical protein
LTLYLDRRSFVDVNERHLRRLLWAYPRAYRRRHGAEILTTLLEAGAGRPGFGESLHLIACGVRQRFRLPRRPLAVLAAVLAAAALGGLGTVAGTRLGWLTAARVPSVASAGALTTAAAGLPWPSVERWRTAMGGPGVNSVISGRGTYDAGRVRSALVGAGWHIDTFTESTGGIVVGVTTPQQTTVPMRDLRFTASRHGLSLNGETTTVTGGAAYGIDGQTDLRLDITADATGAIRPLTIAGLPAGALTGWLMTAALTYGRPRRRLASALSAVALLATGVPAFVAYCHTYQVLIYDTHAPNQYITDTPADGIPPSLILAALTVAAGAAMLSRRKALNSRSGPDREPRSA